MKRAMVTGSGGFAGHHALEHILTTTDWEVVATDSFRHKGKTDRITQVLRGHPGWESRVGVITHDLTAPFSEQAISAIGEIDYLIAMASQSHVDRSIADPVPFIRNNTDVILSTLELARVIRPQTVIVVSTDEVYGPEPVVRRTDPATGQAITFPVPHTEWAPTLPSNPYAASKAAQEAIATAYWRTYSVPVVIVNCMNLVGERQDAEKFVPMLIRDIANGEEVTIHGREGDIGSRHYLHARNLADAIARICEKLPPSSFTDLRPSRWALRPDRYNVAGPDRIDNLALAQMVADVTGKPLRYRLVDFHSARPGHDPHYGLDSSKLAALGWKPPVAFAESLERTVLWSLAHPSWLL